MDLKDPTDKAERLAVFRAKIKDLAIEELVALTTLMKRRTDDRSGELRVLSERIQERRFDAYRKDRLGK